MPSHEVVDRAVALMQKSPQNRIYLFEKLDDPDWIEPLRERGFFTSPPDLIRGEAGITLRAWPESRYLARMALKAPDLVAAVIRDMPETENIRVRVDLVSAASSFAADEAARIAKREAAWIDGHALLGFQYPEAIAQLVARLGALGCENEAIALAGAILAVVPTGDTEFRRTFGTHMEQWTYGRVLATIVDTLATHFGIRALRLSMDLLDRALELEAAQRKPDDLSAIWRPSVGDHEQNVGFDVRDDLIRVIRDTSATWCDDDRDRVVEAGEALCAHEWTIFRRIALWLVKEKLGVAPELAANAILNRENFSDDAMRHEYLELCEAAFGSLNPSQQERWLALLDSGPDWPSRDPAQRAADGLSDESYERYVDIWRRRRLQVIEKDLPPARREQLEELLSVYGREEHPTFPSWHESSVGFISPLNEQEMAAKSAEELVAYAYEWEPMDGWKQPDPEGFARALTQRVATEPGAFCEIAATGALDDLDPTYVRAVLEGFEKAVRSDSGDAISWDGAMHLVELAVRAPAFTHPTREASPSRDWDPDWRNARRASARLLGQAIQSQLIPAEFATRIWDSLNALSWDPEPTPSYERQYGGSNMDPLTLSLNTIRGQAMHAVLAYGVWRKDTGAAKSFTDGVMSAIATNLEDHLNPVMDPSETVRAVFATRLPQLIWVDSDWVRDHIQALFPADNPPLRLAAWESFTNWVRPGPGLLGLLRDEYAWAVRSLPTPEDRRARSGKNPGAALGEHLGTYAWWGALDLTENGLVGQFIERAAPDELAHLIHFLGISMDRLEDIEDLEPAVLDRLQTVWALASKRVRGLPKADANNVLAPFGWWYGSGVLPAEWADSELVSLLRAGVRVDPDFRVGEQLTVRAREDLATSLEIVSTYAASDEVEYWSLYGLRDAFRLTLSLALRSDELRVREEATQAINDLGRRGLLEFRDLLT